MSNKPYHIKYIQAPVSAAMELIRQRRALGQRIIGVEDADRSIVDWMLNREHEVLLFFAVGRESGNE